MTASWSDSDDTTTVARSFLRVLPAAVRERLGEAATAVALPAGRLLYEPEIGIVLTGMLRVFLTSPDGRQLTVSYLRPAAAVGLTAAAGRAHPVAFQAVTDARLLRWRRDQLVEIRLAHPELGWATAQEIAARLDEVVAELDRVAFAGLRARVAYHLLALTDGRRETAVHQATLAVAVGSVREVVARVVTGLRGDGLIETGPAGVRVLDPTGLAHTANQRD